MLRRWVLVAALAAFLGAVAWAVARFGLEKADQTASVVGGSIALLSLPISLYALRAPSSAGAGPAASGAPAAREWVANAAVSASLRPPVPAAPVRGRDSELAMLERLRRGGGMAVVCGAGGLGKTTLAAEAAHRARQAGAAVFWVRWQDDPSRLAEDLTRIAQALGLAEQRLEEARRGQAVLVDVVWEQLAVMPGWVIVVDNVDTPTRIGPGREPMATYRGWLRPDGAGLLIITSRDTAVTTWGQRAQVLNLEPLEEAAAAAVLTDAAPSAGSETDARALALRLGGLPLALEAAGRFLATATSRYRTFTAYREALDQEFGELLGAEHPQAAADPEIARTVVRHTWDLSLEQLHDDGYILARPLLHLLALLEAAPIPRSLITPALLADATGHNVTATALDAALAGLHQYGLLGTPRTTLDASVEDSAAVSVSQVVLHPLVREVMAISLPGSDPTPWHTALDAHLIQAVNDTIHVGRAGWPTARLLAPHLPALLNRAADQTFITTRNTLNELAQTLRGAGAFTEEHLVGKHILDADKRRRGPDHPDTLASRTSFANTLALQGHYQEAADLQQRALADRERTLGPDHPDTLTSRLYFATSLNDLGQYREAADLLRQTLTDCEHILGPDHPDTLTGRNNLANALAGLGQYQEASDLHRHTLADRERILGPDHPDTLTSRHNFATSLNDLGQYREAADLHRHTLADQEHMLGPNHPDTLYTRSNLAVALVGLGQYREAADLDRRTLAYRERTFGPNHPDTLVTRNNLAATLDRLGHHQEAADLHRQTLADRERILGPHHPDTLRSQENLARSEAAAARTSRGRWSRLRRRGRP
ncbi:FxSxx-COOH system tetratricopeptide repeat protein [Streptomyces sp. NPDC085946]|uniref:FxSxx-COOH system tetratricopeptide repeat protein n=1 Tax=Streptomyces sp. NPDC085946 TaxID=3365744 RepID=UPI0037D327D2